MINNIVIKVFKNCYTITKQLLWVGKVRKITVKLDKIIFYAFLLLSIKSCTDNVRTDNSFIIATYDDVKDWDPATAFSLEVMPMSNIYEPLLWYDASVSPGRFVPGLATRYKKSLDGLTWDFFLREGVTFHDGEPFDSKVVKFVIERNKTMNGGASYIWSSVEQVLTKDPYRVTIKLSSPVPLDKIVSSQYGAWMYSPAIANLPFDSLQHGYGAGTGPYQFKNWIKNKHIILEKYDEYWGGWNRDDHFNSIIIKTVSESSTRLQMIENGLVDYALLIPVQLLDRLKKNPNVGISYIPSWVNHFYLLNTKKFPTSNLWVRRSIAASMDRKTISDYIYRGAGDESKGLIPHNIPLFISPDSLISFDLIKAKKYLQKSQIKPGSESINISYVSTSEEYRLTSYLLMDNLRKIGLGLNLNPGLWTMNWDKARKLESSPNIISMAWWPTLPSPSDWFFGLYRTEENPLFNLSHYSNSKIDSLIELAWENESLSPEISKSIYKDIQDILIRDCVVIPVVDINVQSVYNNSIVGLKNNPAYSTLFIYNLGRKQ